MADDLDQANQFPLIGGKFGMVWCDDVAEECDGPRVLGTELSLSSRGRMTLGVGEIFWFIFHTLPQCHALQGVGDTYL
jgi:hypothetical protein